MKSKYSRTELGLCPLCGNGPPHPEAKLCKYCLIKERIKMRKKNHCKPWVPGGRGRPPIVREDGI